MYSIKDLEKDLEKCKEKYKKIKDKKMEDYYACLLEIIKDNKINNHEYVYAYIDNIDFETFPIQSIKANIGLAPINRKEKVMRIIDVLNKKANGSLEDKFMFVFKNKVYIYNKKEDLIMNKSFNSGSWLGIDHSLDNILNDKVLLIQEETTNEDI